MKKMLKLLISFVFIQTGFCMTEQDVIDEAREKEQELKMHKRTDGDHLNKNPSVQEDELNGDRRLPPRPMLRSRSGGSSSSDGSWGAD